MVRPVRETFRKLGYSYFISTQTAERTPFFRHERWARLFLDVLRSNAEITVLHSFVVMPDHMHLLMSPEEPIEKAVQRVKGGFSFRAKRELEWNSDIWQPGFADHRIRDLRDWDVHLDYIRMNPVRARLSERPEEYPYGSWSSDIVLAPIPQRLKPLVRGADDGGAEAPPFHSNNR